MILWLQLLVRPVLWSEKKNEPVITYNSTCFTQLAIRNKNCYKASLMAFLKFPATASWWACLTIESWVVQFIKHCFYFRPELLISKTLQHREQSKYTLWFPACDLDIIILCTYQDFIRQNFFKSSLSPIHINIKEDYSLNADFPSSKSRLGGDEKYDSHPVLVARQAFGKP